MDVVHRFIEAIEHKRIFFQDPAVLGRFSRSEQAHVRAILAMLEQMLFMARRLSNGSDRGELNLKPFEAKFKEILAQIALGDPLKVRSYAGRVLRAQELLEMLSANVARTA